MFSYNVNIYNVMELKNKTSCFLGVGAIDRFSKLIKKFKEDYGLKRALIVTGRSSYKSSGAWDHVKKALNEYGIEYVHFDKVSSNPTADNIDEASKLGRDFGADFVIPIGGGSPIDTAKAVSVLLEYTNEDARSLYAYKFTPKKAKPIIAINTTHGTGSEVNKFAVTTIPEKRYKLSIAYDCIYPVYSIDDPVFTSSMSYEQTLYTSIDALNHAVEAATTVNANPYSIYLAKEVVRLVVYYLPQALMHPCDLVARYYLLYASAVAGIAFDNARLHITHALEHPLSALNPDLSHGLGLALLLPHVVSVIYPAVGSTLAYVLEPIVGSLMGYPAEEETVVTALESWLYDMGINKRLSDFGFSKENIDELTKLSFDTPSSKFLLSLAPVKVNEDTVKTIFEMALL